MDVVVVYGPPAFLGELAAKLGRELSEGALVCSNAYPLPDEEGALDHLTLVREVPVETEAWNPDGSSSLWLYRVSHREERMR